MSVPATQPQVGYSALFQATAGLDTSRKKLLQRIHEKLVGNLAQYEALLQELSDHICPSYCESHGGTNYPEATGCDIDVSLYTSEENGTRDAEETQVGHNFAGDASREVMRAREVSRVKRVSAHVSHWQSLPSPVGPSRCTQWLLQVVESRAFERIVLLIIFLNVIFAGILVQETTCSMWRAQQQCLNQHYLQIIQLMFASFYILELSFRIFAKKSQFFHHAGQTLYLAIFELLLTILAVVERVVSLMSELPNQSFMQFTCLYMALLRSVRLITFGQTSDSFQQLQDLLHSMIQTMKSLVWLFLFMAAILYAFGLMFTLAASHHFQSQQKLGVSMKSLDMELRENFGSVLRSAYTLYIATTGGVDWDGVADVLAHVGAAWTGAFVVYQIVFYFAVMNVVTGMFCQAVFESANQDPKRIIRRELDSMRSHATNLQNVFCKIAGSNSGSFTLTELQSALEDAEMKAFFFLFEYRHH